MAKKGRKTKAEIEEINRNTDIIIKDAEVESAKLEAERMREMAEASVSVCKTIGMIQTAGFTEKQSKLMKYIWLLQIKKSGEYKKIRGIETMEKVCEICNVPYSTFNLFEKDINKLGVLADEYLQQSILIGWGPTEARKFARLCNSNIGDSESHKLLILKETGSEKSPTVGDLVINLDGKQIPFDPDHKEEIEETYMEVIEAERRAKRKLENEIKELQKTHELEKKALTARIAQLEPFEPKDVNKEALEKFNRVEELLQEVDKILRSFVFKDDVLSDDVFAKTVGILKRIRERLDLFEENFSIAYEEFKEK